MFNIFALCERKFLSQTRAISPMKTYKILNKLSKHVHIAKVQNTNNPKNPNINNPNKQLTMDMLE